MNLGANVLSFPNILVRLLFTRINFIVSTSNGDFIVPHLTITLTSFQLVLVMPTVGVESYAELELAVISQCCSNILAIEHLFAIKPILNYN